MRPVSQAAPSLYLPGSFRVPNSLNNAYKAAQIKAKAKDKVQKGMHKKLKECVEKYYYYYTTLVSMDFSRANSVMH